MYRLDGVIRLRQDRGEVAWILILLDGASKR